MAKKKAKRRASRKRPLRSKKTIEAKPTLYRGTQFKSRLEARWAVLLDWYEHIDNWHYEPKTFKLKEEVRGILPTLFFQWSTFPGFIEVKPDVPSKEYLQVLAAFLPILPLPLTLAFGDFYKGKPKFWAMNLSKHWEKPTPAVVKREALTMETLWPNAELGIKTASHYRFDLQGKDPLPPFRQPQNAMSPLDFMRQWEAEQLEANRGQSLELLEQRRKAMKKARRGKT